MKIDKLNELIEEMKIDKLNELIEEIKPIQGVLRIKTFETYPNVHPTLKNPLNHLNDIRVEFSICDVNIFGVHMLSEMNVKDFFNEIDKIANKKLEWYTNWKQTELREYNINKIIDNE
jgi:hypothetical protein